MHFHSQHCNNKLDQARQIRCLALQLQVCVYVTVCVCVCLVTSCTTCCHECIIFEIGTRRADKPILIRTVFQRNVTELSSLCCSLPLALYPSLALPLIELTNETLKQSCYNTIFVCYSFLIFSSLMKPLNICGASCCVYTQVCALTMRVCMCVCVYCHGCQCRQIEPTNFWQEPGQGDSRTEQLFR